MQRKFLTVVMLLLVGAMVLSACAVPTPAGQEPTAAEPTAAAMEEPMGESYTDVDPTGQTVVWWHNHSGSREEGLLGLIEQFNSSNEYGITVDAQNQGSYNDIRDKVNASIGAGEQPAALLVGYQNDQAFYQLNDTLVDLNLLMDDPTWGFSADEKADFYASFMEQGLHPLFDNQRLGFPPNRSMEVLYYNQTWLEELGFAGPPTTPDEFKEMACAAAAEKGDGTGGYILRDDASAVASWTFAFGGDVLTEDGTEYVYNSQATIDAMTFLKGLYDDGCAYFFTEGFPNPQFAARNAIFTQGSSSGIPFYQSDIDTAATDRGTDPDAWGVAAIPHTTADPVQNLYGGDIMITKTTPEQEVAAWIFIKWFTSPEIQAQWDQISGYFPTRAGTNEFLTDYLASNPQWAQAVEMLPYGAYEPQAISYQAVRDAVTAAYNEIMQGADIQTTLDNLTTSSNEQQATMMAELE
ncbi:MAG: extracellular solute-binding protein [Caldilineaceae bacterium]